MTIEILSDAYARWSPPTPGGRVELDMGCGKGGFLLELARRYPDRLVLGADIMLGRLRRVARKVRHRGLNNARLLRVDAWQLVGYILPDRCLDRVHVICPDPWPKKRHAHRRLLCSEFFGRLAPKLKPGGILHLATDDRPYFAFIQAAVRGNGRWQPTADGIDDVRDIRTEFQRRFESQGTSLQRLVLQRVGEGDDP